MDDLKMKVTEKEVEKIALKYIIIHPPCSTFIYSASEKM
jgi:hypothetical protein